MSAEQWGRAQTLLATSWIDEYSFVQLNSITITCSSQDLLGRWCEVHIMDTHCEPSFMNSVSGVS